MYKFHNQFLSATFHSYFTKVANVHSYNTRLASKQSYYNPYIRTNMVSSVFDSKDLQYGIQMKAILSRLRW